MSVMLQRAIRSCLFRCPPMVRAVGRGDPKIDGVLKTNTQGRSEQMHHQKSDPRTRASILL